MPITLTPQQKFELVDKLLDCPHFTSQSDRQLVARQLSKKIHTSISLGSTSDAKTETLATVEACLNFEQGLTELISAVRFFDGATIQFKALEGYLKELEKAETEPSQKPATLIPPARAVTELPIPRRNPLFTGREKELNELHAALAASSTVALIALHGLGGIGKTSLALEYCYRYQADYELIAWLPSETVAGLQQAFLGLTSMLGLPELPTDTAESQAYLIQTIKQELARPGKGNNNGKDWLLIFDNAEQPEDIEPFLPGGLGATGHVIITSRNKQLATLGQSQQVAVLAEVDALTLLAKHCHRQLKPSEHGSGFASASELKAARLLIEALGYLALAITQAGSYIYATGCSVTEYLELFSSTKAELFSDELARPKDYPATVATTWELAFTKVREQSPGAADLINLMAFFAPNGIDLAWLVSTDVKIRESLSPVLAELTSNKSNLNRSLALLQKYSLITRRGEYLSIHQLVQLIIRSNLTKRIGEVYVSDNVTLDDQVASSAENIPSNQLDGYIWWLCSTVTFLLAVFPNPNEYENIVICDTLIGHVEYAFNYYIEHTSKIENDFYIQTYTLHLLRQFGILFGRASIYFRYRGLYAKAKPLAEQAVILIEKVQGDEHVNLAIWLGNLALLLQDMGDYTKAKTLYERAIVIGEKKLGGSNEEQLMLATWLNNQAILLSNLGDYVAAKTLIEQAIAIGERVYSTDQPRLASWLNTLASLLQAQGDYAAAKVLAQRVVAIGEKMLSPTHPDLAVWLSNLATLLHIMGEYTEAKYLFERVISITKSALGDEHPSVAKGLNNLAALLYTMGDYLAAKPYYEEAIFIGKKTLYLNHPDLATWFNNYANLLSHTKDYTTAIHFHEQALLIREKALGANHPDVAQSFSNLASLLSDCGSYNEAISLLERAVSINERQFGKSHPVFASNLTNLAIILTATGDTARAEVLCKESMIILEKALGTEHPDLAVNLTTQGHLYYKMGEMKKAQSCLKRALAIFEKTLGSTHSNTISTIELLVLVENKLIESSDLVNNNNNNNESINHL